MHLLPRVFLLLLVAELVVHVAFLHLRAALHEPLHDLVHLFVLTHVLNLLLVRFGNGEASEVEVRVVLDQAFAESDVLEAEEDFLLLLEGLLVLLCVVLLLLVPELEQLSGFECLDLLLLLDEIIAGIEPGIELVESSLVVASFVHIGVPGLHLCQSVLELLLGPNEEHLVRFLVFAEDDQFWHSSHIILDIDDCVDTEVEVLHLERELLVAVEGVFVGLVHVLEEGFELFDELGEEVLLQAMLELAEEGFHAFGLDGASCQLVVQVLAVFSTAEEGLPEVVGCALARNDELEVVCVAEGDSVEMVEFYPLTDERTVDEDLGFWLRLEEDFPLLVDDRAMPCGNTEGVELDLIFLSVFGADLGLAFLDIVEQHSQESRIFGYVHDVRELALVDIRLTLL